MVRLWWCTGIKQVSPRPVWYPSGRVTAHVSASCHHARPLQPRPYLPSPPASLTDSALEATAPGGAHCICPAHDAHVSGERLCLPGRSGRCLRAALGLSASLDTLAGGARLVLSLYAVSFGFGCWLGWLRGGWDALDRGKRC